MSEAETIVGLGARTDYLAQVPHLDPGRLHLSADEDLIFTKIGRATRIDEIISRSGFAEAKAIALLLSLRAKGAVVPARVARPSGNTVVDAAMSEEVDLPPDRKKEILDLERGLDVLDHFQVLGLRPGATVDEARQAYFAASRRYHPDRYYGRNIGSFRYRVDRIFRRLTEAYETLSDPERRAAFLRANPHLDSRPAPAPPEPPVELDPERAAERRARMARHPYLARSARLHELQARARALVAQGEPGRALADLDLALRIEPQNKDLLTLQAEARRKHDAIRVVQELEKARQAERSGDVNEAMARYRMAASVDPTNSRAALKAAQYLRFVGADPNEVRALAQRAVDIDPRNADAHALLGALLADTEKKLARKHVETALQIDPDHAEAKKQLRKMRWPF